MPESLVFGSATRSQVARGSAHTLPAPTSHPPPPSCVGIAVGTPSDLLGDERASGTAPRRYFLFTERAPNPRLFGASEEAVPMAMAVGAPDAGAACGHEGARRQFE